MHLPSGFEFVSDEPHGPPAPVRRLVGTIVNEHGRRYPRTLAQAFKQSEGYRFSGYAPPPKQHHSAVVWLVTLGLSGWFLWIATHAPRVAQ